MFQSPWVLRALWSGIAAFFFVVIALVVASHQGWIGPPVRDYWTFEQLEKHLDRKGVRVVLTEKSRTEATLNETSTNGWVIVHRARSNEEAREKVKFESRNWPSYCVAGPFVIVAFGPEKNHADLCSRICHACRD